MKHKPHDGKRMEIEWYTHRVNHRNGVYDVLRAERVKGTVGLIAYLLKSQKGQEIEVTSNDMHACRVLTAA